MPITLTDGEAAAVILFLSECECQGDAVGQVCAMLLRRAAVSLRGEGVGHPSSPVGGATGAATRPCGHPSNQTHTVRNPDRDHNNNPEAGEGDNRTGHSTGLTHLRGRGGGCGGGERGDAEAKGEADGGSGSEQEDGGDEGTTSEESEGGL